MSSTLTGTRPLVRLALRRDRIMVPLWLLAVVGIVLASASALAELYPTAAEREQFASGIGANPALRALTGRVYDASTVGGLTAWRVVGLGAMFLGLMSIFVVTRHTRAEEESGRLELLGSTVVGRRAPLASALGTMMIANAVAAVLLTAGVIAAGEDAAGAVHLALSSALAGVVFGTVAAVTAQLTESARAANAMASAVLAVSFVLRAVADASSADGPTWLSWLSPIGWAQQVRPFGGDRTWVLVLMVAVAALLAGVAAVLNGHRDLGAGILATRGGHDRAAAYLSGPLSLAWRLQRTGLLGWLVGFVGLGAAFGSIAPGIGDIASTSPQIEQILRQLGGPGAITDAFLGAIFGVLALIGSAYAVTATLRLRSEETGLLAELVLSTATSRTAWLTGHLLLATLGPAVLLAAAAVSAAVAYDVTADGSGSVLGQLLAAAAVQLPAVWVVVGISIVLFGAAPGVVQAAWGVLAAFVIIGQFGATLQLPQWLIDASPFGHVPNVPAEAVTWTPMVILVGLAGLLIVVGMLAFNRRDVSAS